MKESESCIPLKKDLNNNKEKETAFGNELKAVVFPFISLIWQILEGL